MINNYVIGVHNIKTDSIEYITIDNIKGSFGSGKITVTKNLENVIVYTSEETLRNWYKEYEDWITKTISNLDTSIYDVNSVGIYKITITKLDKI